MRRPWNLVNSPVYSLATYRDGQVNMNICTYVTAVSRKPKLYTIALEHGSQTLENIEQSDHAILQLLRAPHASLIRLLGKSSGKKINKGIKLEKKSCLTIWRDHLVLKDVAAYLFLEKQHCQTTGDHDLYLFSVKHYSSLSDQDILMFQDLIDQKIIL